MTLKHVESLLPKDRKWKLVWNDEFDGDKLDESKWSYRLHIMQRRHETFTDQAAELDGKGNLMLKLLEKNGQFYSSQLQTGSNFMDRPGESFEKFRWPIAKIEKPKFMHKHGYYEARCKLPTQDGWWVAFWLQSPIIGSTLDPKLSGVEVDIMENFATDDNGAISSSIVSHNHHWNGYGEDHRQAGSGNRKLKETPDGFHVFGCHWSEEGYVHYIDGEESWRISSPVSDREQFILISAECRGYRSGEQPCEELKRAKLPDSFLVDYVRVFDEVK